MGADKCEVQERGRGQLGENRRGCRVYSPTAVVAAVELGAIARGSLRPREE